MAWGFSWLVLVFILLTAWLLVRRQRAQPSEAEQRTQFSLPVTSAAQQQVLDTIENLRVSADDVQGVKRLAVLRQAMDSLSDELILDSKIRPSETPAPIGEWVIAPNAKPNRRLLYIHGGFWAAGSPKSHRAITDRLSRLTGACVFALDYRLMPEHGYQDGILDCREAYIWLQEQGPEGPRKADFMVIAGDSAGGTHTLGLIAWLRDQQLPLPTAAIALSPSTDLTLRSLRKQPNFYTDVMLGPTIDKLAAIPFPLLWAGAAFAMRALPSNPLVSPIQGDLSGLPPTLIHVSEAELLAENVQRYVTKAQAQGTPVEMRTWPNMVHVWHLFTPLLSEAEAAFQDIGAFLDLIENANCYQSR